MCSVYPYTVKMKNQTKPKMQLKPNMKQVFEAWQKDHYNFMTPKIEKLLVHYNIVVEVSSGRPFIGQAVRGVTVYYLDIDNRRFINVGAKDKLNLDRAFSGRPWEQVEQDALTYANKALKDAVMNYEKIAEWI